MKREILLCCFFWGTLGCPKMSILNIWFACGCVYIHEKYNQKLFSFHTYYDKPKLFKHILGLKNKNKHFSWTLLLFKELTKTDSLLVDIRWGYNIYISLKVSLIISCVNIIEYWQMVQKTKNHINNLMLWRIYLQGILSLKEI